MSTYYDPDYEPPTADDYCDTCGHVTDIDCVCAETVPEPREEAQPNDFCECRPGRELRHPHQHAPDCPRWSPPLTGPGSTPQGRARALEEIRRTLANARRQHQETQP
jgi:hypothetical protein